MKDTILSVIRHILTFGGGILIAVGYVTDTTWATVASAVPTAVGAVWGAADEYRAARAARE
jgi:hypothetical protein